MNIYSLYTGNFQAVFCNLDSRIFENKKIFPDDKGAEYYIHFSGPRHS
jgi:hypothetical protein